MQAQQITEIIQSVYDAEQDIAIINIQMFHQYVLIVILIKFCNLREILIDDTFFSACFCIEKSILKGFVLEIKGIHRNFPFSSALTLKMPKID